MGKKRKIQQVKDDKTPKNSVDNVKPVRNSDEPVKKKVRLKSCMISYNVFSYRPFSW